jgi:chromosome segregation ATPase
MNEENLNDVRTRGTRDSFMERLQQASTELDSIKSSFSKGMEDLAKIQSMLDLDGLNKMDQMIHTFELRLSDAEQRREEAAEGARRYSQELDKEKDRLVKLWEAYKNQEESLAIQEKRVAELEERTRDAEQSKMAFERDATARIRTLTQKLEEKERDTTQIEEFRSQMLKSENIRAQLEGNLEKMRGEFTAKDNQVRALEKQVEELKGFEQFAGFKTKFEEVSSEFEKEKERLIKLFQLYEETEAENKTLKEDLHEWQSWFAANEELFTKLFTSVEHLKHRSTEPAQTSMSDEDIEIPPSLDTNHEPPGKPKRKHLFRH